MPRNILFSVGVRTFLVGSRKIERQYMNMCSKDP